MEYPGYGIYSGKSSADKILWDAENVYLYLTSILGISEDNLVLFGRSIGSGPAVFLASKYSPKCLLLMSAYTSIKAVAKKLTGSFPAFFFADRFRNVDLINKVTCSALLIHGRIDTLIPYNQSLQLKAAYVGDDFEKEKKMELILPQYMDHNTFHFQNDILNPIGEFLVKNKFILSDQRASLHFPSFYKNGELVYVDEEEKQNNGLFEE